jgi:hypothetical protein
MTRTDEPMRNDAGLEAFFEAARKAAPEPSAALLARVLADAEAELAARARPAMPAVPRRPGHWLNFVRGLGGWPALAGMATAAVAGVWLGFATPDSLNTLSGGLLLPDSAAATSYDLEDMLPGYVSFAALGEEVQG